jgi:hypothetical protein
MRGRNWYRAFPYSTARVSVGSIKGHDELAERRQRKNHQLTHRD